MTSRFELDRAQEDASDLADAPRRCCKYSLNYGRFFD